MGRDLQSSATPFHTTGSVRQGRQCPGTKAPRGLVLRAEKSGACLCGGWKQSQTRVCTRGQGTLDGAKGASGSWIWADTARRGGLRHRGTQALQHILPAVPGCQRPPVSWGGHRKGGVAQVKASKALGSKTMCQEEKSQPHQKRTPSRKREGNSWGEQQFPREDRGHDCTTRRGGKKFRKKEHVNQPWSSKVNPRRSRSPRTTPSYCGKAWAVPTDERPAEENGTLSVKP